MNPARPMTAQRPENLVWALQQQFAQQRRTHREEVSELKAAPAEALGENLAVRRQAAEAGRHNPPNADDGECAATT